MKRTIIAAAVILATGILSSCTKDNSVKPATSTSAQVVYGNGQDPKNLGSGDGTPDSPSN